MMMTRIWRAVAVCWASMAFLAFVMIWATVAEWMRTPSTLHVVGGFALGIVNLLGAIGNYQVVRWVWGQGWEEDEQDFEDEEQSAAYQAFQEEESK